MTEPSRHGQIITFYSFKGGVGRSMALANIAAIHAQRGKRVLALDFDFEAPGLHRYFLMREDAPLPRYEPPRPQQGMLNFFYALRQRLRAKWPDGQGFQQQDASDALPALFAELFDGNYLYHVRLENPNDRRAPAVEMDFVAAARFDETYSDLVRAFDWQEFYDDYAEVFPAFARELAQRYDYVLIDSRTGVTDIGSICTMMLPDKLVLVFSPNEQSLRGALDAGWQAVQGRKHALEPRKLPLFPLLSRVEDSEEKLRRSWISRVRAEFEQLFRKAFGLDECNLDTYFNAIQVPHRSFYAYGERIAAEEQAATEIGSLAHAFHRLADCLDFADANEARQNLGRNREKEKAERITSVLSGISDERRQPDEQELMRRALSVAAAVILHEKGHPTEAIKILDEVVKETSDATDVLHKGILAAALHAQFDILSALGRYEDALAQNDEILRRFESSTEASLHIHIAQALASKGEVLRKLNRDGDALMIYEQMLEKFDTSVEPPILRQVARVLVNKAAALSTLKRDSESLAVCEQVVQRFSDSTDSDLQEAVARALIGKSVYGKVLIEKGKALTQLARYGEAVATYEHLFARFHDTTEPEIQGLITHALTGAGFALLCQAKQGWQGGDETAARLLLAKASAKLAMARERKPDDPVVLEHAGYVAFLLGRPDEARDLLARSIALGGENLRTAALQDADIHSLPQDEAFRVLVCSLPATAGAST